ncbi:hypothetical protein [Parasphingorhabdus sp.]|uniref:hypothetical protein n=1 Tax=Parasphingorhabdus sp. TaxID=2709688 RepID=UPI002F921D3A
MTEKPKNSGDRQDTMYRVQVGVIGLVAVLLLVSLANFVLQRASDEQSATEVVQAETASDEQKTPGKEASSAPSEPLAELGVTPTRVPEGDKSNPAESGKPVQIIVPDLEPDPKLEAPMDREG